MEQEYSHSFGFAEDESNWYQVLMLSRYYTEEKNDTPVRRDELANSGSYVTTEWKLNHERTACVQY